MAVSATKLRMYDHLNDDPVYDPVISTTPLLIRAPVEAVTNALIHSNCGVNRMLGCLADKIRAGEGYFYDPKRERVAKAIDDVLAALME